MNSDSVFCAMMKYWVKVSQKAVQKRSCRCKFAKEERGWA
jgi:hypothetical protein